MSFVDGEDVIEVNERLLAHVFERAGGPTIELPMQRMGYDEAMSRFGTDRPDLRFGLELVDLSDALRETEFKVFRSVLEGGGAIRGLNAGKREMPRSELDGLISRAQELGAKGLVWAFREGDGWRSPTAKFLSDAELADLNAPARGRGGRPAAAGRRQAGGDQRGARADAARPRRALRADRPRRPPPGLDRRLAAASSGTRTSAAGTRCTIPSPRPAGAFDPDDPGAARALAYDVVWNGQELGGGSIRIHDAEVQQRRLRARSGSTRRRPRRASASCSRRSATGRRRTAASPTGSTASSSG